MKKIFLIASLLLTAFSAAQACDICGCGAGSNYLGILPDFNARIVGLRFRNSEIRTHVGPNGESSYLTTLEHYNTFELWGGWNIGKHFRIMATLPLNYDTKNGGDDMSMPGMSMPVKTSMTGLGDATVQGFYRVFNRNSSIGSNLLVQDLWVGAGIKLPTGKYNPNDETTTNENANLFQLGTGSFDFIFTGMYDIRLQDVGLNVSASYKVNTTNKYDYSYGNKFSTTTQLYYKFRISEKATLAPNAGISYENAAKDLNGGDPSFNSGGYALFGTLGIEAKYRNIAAGGNWQPSLSQDLAAGIVQARNKMMVHVAFTF